jgi:hypothetical protein
MRLGLFALCCFSATSSVHGWQPLSLLPKKWTHNRIEASLVEFSSPAKVLATGMMLVGVLCVSSPALADDWQEGWQSSLRAPTEDQPQILLPKDSNKSLPSPTTVQALISLANPQLRPVASDVLVIQIYDESWDQQTTSQQLLLGGAKIPVAKIRFPMKVQLGPQNAKVIDDWNRLASSQDLWIVASVCPEGNAPCSASEQRFETSGISKLLKQLPGMDESTTGVGLRVPASLALNAK